MWGVTDDFSARKSRARAAAPLPADPMCVLSRKFSTARRNHSTGTDVDYSRLCAIGDFRDVNNGRYTNGINSG